MTCRAEGASETRPCRQTPVVREARRAPSEKKKTARPEASIDATRGRERTRSEPLDRGLSPHVSCQAKARVPICAPKDRFTRVLAASFMGAPRYTREVFILGSRSSPFSAPSVADAPPPPGKSKNVSKKKLKRLDPRRRDGVKPVLLGGRRSRFVVWYAHRLSLLTNSLECCRHSKGRRVDARLSFPGRKAEKKKRKESLRAVSKRRRTETRIVSPLFPTDQYKHVSLYGPTNAASRNEIRAQLPDVTARCLLGLSRKHH